MGETDFYKLLGLGRSASADQIKARRKTLKIPQLRLPFSKQRAGYFLAAAMGILVLVYAGRSEPDLPLHGRFGKSSSPTAAGRFFD